MLVLDALATARLTRAWTQEADEFPLLMPLHKPIATALTGTAWEPLLDCPWCTSFWIGIGVAGLRRVVPRVWNSVAFALAASLLTGLVHMWEEREQLRKDALNRYEFEVTNG